MSRSVSKLFAGALLVNTSALTTESLAINGWRLERTASAAAVELSETLTHVSATETTTTETLQTETITEVLKLELHLSARQLYVYRGETLIANYSVAVAEKGGTRLPENSPSFKNRLTRLGSILLPERLCHQDQIIR